MKSILMKSALLALALLVHAGLRAQTTTFYNRGTVQKIEMYFAQPDWDHLMDSLKAGPGGYIMASWVKINGVQYDSVGVKYKGNSSYDSSSLKNPFTIKLNKYKTQTHEGITDIKLANIYKDPSFIREVMAYAMLGNYMHCPRSNFAQVYINGQLLGIYSNDEDVNKKFVTEHFYAYNANRNPFFKCSYDNPTPLNKTALKYLGSDSSLYQAYYEIQSNVGWKSLVNLADTLTNYGSYADKVMDMDRALWMLAFNNAIVNMDSYSGLFAQNYFLMKDNAGLYNPIVWDLNMAFGGFPYMGTNSGGTGTLSIAQQKALSPAIHATDTEWPLIRDVAGNAMWRRMYLAHLRTFVKEMMANGAYNSLAGSLHATIDTAVQSDPNKAYSFAQYQSAMTTDISIGNYSVPGLSSLMDARVAYLLTDAEFIKTPPAVAAITASATAPDTGTNVTLRARISNVGSGAVYLGYRFDSTLHFTRVQLYDDGAHGDSLAADGIYGNSVHVNSTWGQYYVYAENADAGVFFPARAEHEFYRFSAQPVVPTAVTSISTRNAALKVYPNPAGSSFTVEQSGSNALRVINSSGQQVYSGIVTGKTTVSTEAWPAGLYFVQCGEAFARMTVTH